MPKPMSKPMQSDQAIVACKNDAKNKARKKVYEDGRRGSKQHNLKVGDKVIEDQIKNYKVCNKTKSRFSAGILTIKETKGSMVTVENQNGVEHTLNASFFKRVPDVWKDDIDWNLDSFSTAPAVSENCDPVATTSESETVQPVDANTQVVEIQQQGQTQEQRATTQEERRSRRTRNAPNRNVAEPASGLINRLPKAKTRGRH